MINVKLERLPFLNLRLEYRHYKTLLADPKFRKTLTGSKRAEFHCGKFVWASANEGITVLLQRVILSFEASIPLSVMLELACTSRLTANMLASINDPMRLPPSKGRRSGAADCYFNLLPSLVHPQHALEKSDPELWKLVQTFYREIRNKIFHGYYVTSMTPEDLDYMFSVFDRIWVWCDSWCNFEQRFNDAFKGTIKIKLGST